MKRLILASKSPAKREVLERAGFRLEVVSSDVDETPHAGESPTAYVERLAQKKAEAGARLFRPQDNVVVLGADTVIVMEGRILGKPDSGQQAREMLEKLSGQAHEVISGVALAEPGSARRLSAHEVTRVFFRRLAPQEIEDYVASGEPLGKAGAYAIQGRAARFVRRVEGCYFNVVGVPLALVERLLREWERK